MSRWKTISKPSLWPRSSRCGSQNWVSIPGTRIIIFGGPWHSNPMQFAAYIAPQISADRYLGFGVLSAPLYHPVRLVESMNLLDQLTRGKALFGIGSGWQGSEVAGLGVDPDYHKSGRATEDTLDVMVSLWNFRDGDPEYNFEVGSNRGRIMKRIMPAPYTKRHPIIIRTASRDSALVRAAQNGWPAFLGIFGGDVRKQARTYRRALATSQSPAIRDRRMFALVHNRLAGHCRCGYRCGSARARKIGAGRADGDTPALYRQIR